MDHALGLGTFSKVGKSISEEEESPPLVRGNCWRIDPEEGGPPAGVRRGTSEEGGRGGAGPGGGMAPASGLGNPPTSARGFLHRQGKLGDILSMFSL